MVRVKLDNESLLVANVLKGDMDSFSTLVSKYRDRIYNFVFKMTLSREDTEDIVQDVFIRVYNNLYKYNSKWCFSTWIYRIALNLFKSNYAKKKRAQSINYQKVLAQFPDDLIDDPGVIYEMKEYNTEVLRILDNLKHDQKAILILKHVQGFSYREIAEILKISPENARIKVMRAKQTLYKEFIKLKQSKNTE